MDHDEAGDNVDWSARHDPNGGGDVVFVVEIVDFAIEGNWDPCCYGQKADPKVEVTITEASGQPVMRSQAFGEDTSAWTESLRFLPWDVHDASSAQAVRVRLLDVDGGTKDDEIIDCAKTVDYRAAASFVSTFKCVRVGDKPAEVNFRVTQEYTINATRQRELAERFSPHPLLPPGRSVPSDPGRGFATA